MVKKWSDVSSSPDFAALSDDDKDTVRSAYFERVVAPNVAPDQLDATRAQFETAAGYHRRSLPAGVQPSNVQGGRSAQGGPTADEMQRASQSKQMAPVQSFDEGLGGVAADDSSASPAPESVGLTPAQPWASPQARRGTMRAVTPFVGGDTKLALEPPDLKQTSVLDNARAAPDDAMLNPVYIDKMRADFGQMPEAQRLPILREMAQDNNVRGRAAQALLAQVTRENAATNPQDDALAKQLVGMPQAPAAPGSPGAPPAPVRFPDTTPTYGDILDNTQPQAIAARRSLAMGLGQEKTNQNVSRWAADETAANAEAKAQKAVRDSQPSFIQDPLFHIVDTIRDAQAGLRQIGPIAAKTAWDLLRMGADATNAKDFASIAKGASDNGSEVIHSLDNPNGDHNIQGAFASLGTALLGAGFAGEAGALILGSAQAGGDKYSEARNAGFSTGDAATAAATYFASELIGEKISMPSLGRLAFKGILAQGLGPKAAVHSALKEGLKEGLKEQGGEGLTQTMESLYDKFGPAGGKPNLTFDEYLSDMIDVVKQTAIMTAVAGGTGHISKKMQERAIRIGLQDATEAREHAQHTAAAMDEQQLRNTYDAGRQPTAYEVAAQQGFHVAPPLSTDSPDKQRSKTIGVFQALAAQYGLDPDAEARAVETAKSMPAADVGPFLARLTDAFQKRGLVASPVGQHATATLTAGPIEDPKEIDAKIKELAKSNAEAAASRETSGAPAAPEEDLSGLSEPSEPVHPQQDSDLTTGDGQPYGTRGSAAARATREGAGEVVRVQGGWVVRTELAQNAADESAQPDLRTAPAEPAPSPAGRSGEPGGSEPTVGRVAADTGKPGENAPGKPVASSGAPGPVRENAEAPGAVGPRVIAQIGTMPSSARPLELRSNKDGTLTPWHAGHEVVDFESGDPVKIPGNATDAQALDAVKKSGAFGRRTKYFQTNTTTAAGSSSTAPNTGTGETPGTGKASTPEAKPTGAPHAAQEVSQPASVQGEHQDGNQGRQAPEAGSGDRVQRAGGGEEGKPAAAPQEVAPKAGETDQPATAAEAHEALQRGETLVHHRGTEHESRTWLAETKVGEKGQTWVIKSKSADSPVTITKGPAGPDRAWGWGKTDAAAKAVEGMHFDEKARGPQDKRGLRAEDRALAELHSNSEDLAAQMANDVREDDFDAAEVLPALIAWAKKANLPVDTLRTDVLRQLGTMELKKADLKKLTAALEVKAEPAPAPAAAAQPDSGVKAMGPEGDLFDTGETVALYKKTRRFASGMSRISDLIASGRATGGLDLSGVGVDVGELSGPAIEALATAIVHHHAAVFVDSGAFGAFRRGLKVGQFKAMDFDAILAKYDDITSAIDEANKAEDTDYIRPMLVMPDVVGDQQASLDLIAKHRAWIKAEAKANLAQLIIPIQKGELSMAEAYAKVVELLGTDNFIAGIPSNEKAVTPEELTQFLRDAKPKAIHILGAAAKKNLMPRLQSVIESGISRQIDVSADSSPIRNQILTAVKNGAKRGDAIEDHLYDENDPAVVRDKRRQAELDAKPKDLTDAQAFAQDYAAFTGRTVTRTVPIAGTTRTASLKSDARKAMQALDTRLKALEELKTCIGAHS